MNIQSEIQKMIHTSAQSLLQVAENKELLHSFEKSVELIVDSYKKGGCLYVAGNGGSAADAQHIVAELVVRLHRDRNPIKAFAFTTDSSILTAIGNDYDYDQLFSRQVQAAVGENDVFLALTTSGNSPNILNALKACREKGGKSILLSGREGGKAKPLADVSIISPAQETYLIQESHIVIYHQLCYFLELGLVEAGICQYLD